MHNAYSCSFMPFYKFIITFKHVKYNIAADIPTL